ncbi:MAG: hypothetical protein QM661_04610 [Solimonas sp.]
MRSTYDWLDTDGGAARVLAVPCGDRRVWLKMPGPPKWRPWHWLQWILVRALSLPFLRPTASRGQRDELRNEAKRMLRFSALGLPAPQVLSCSRQYLVTADAGPTLSSYLARGDDLHAQRAALVAAARALGRVHAAGQCHGRPFIKDLAYDGERVTFLDFEENPCSVMSLADAQARDLCLFLMSVVKHTSRKPGSRLLLGRLLVAYAQVHPPRAIVGALRRNLRALDRLAAPFRRLPRRWLGRDLAAALLIESLLLGVLDSPSWLSLF